MFKASISGREALLRLFAVLVLVTMALLYWWRVERSTRAQVQQRIEQRQAQSVEQFDAWFDGHVRQARQWAELPRTRELATQLLRKADAPAEALNADPLQVSFRRDYGSSLGREGLQGYLIISPQGRNLASAAPDNTGIQSLLWQEPEFVDAMRTHGAALSPLMVSDIDLKNGGAMLDDKPLTLFIGVPILLDGTEPAAFFAVRIPPVDLLARQGQARFGQGGISFLVDRFGRLHADRSWLNLDFDEYGLRSESFRDRPALFVRDPGRNLLTHPGTGDDREHLPLTRSAAGLQRGKGSTLKPYRDHRGVEVVGSWVWDDKLGLGVVTEIPAAEAFAPIAAAGRNILIATTLLAVLVVTTLMFRLRRSSVRLRAALINAEAASRAKGVFVANMSHEIRTPLNAVLGIAHLLRNTPLTPAQQDYVRMIGTSGEALLGILNDILDYSKVEAGKLELVKAEFSLYGMFDSLSSIMSINAAPKDLELVIGIEPDVPMMLVGDSHRLLQILVNLTGNAIKFTHKGEVVLRVGAPSRDGDTVWVRFEVRDTGVGIPLDKQGQLFSAFTQADAGIARHYGGSGLGLAICKRLVDLMGGDIGVSSVEGQGSEFWFTVPMAIGTVSRTPMSEMVNDVHQVLVVDDNAIAREFVSKSVERLGWASREVASGADALTSVTTGAFDVLLIDWKMPGMDGMETSKAIRSLPGVRQPPIVIMVTAFGREQVLGSPDAAVIDGVIDKPTTPSKILDAVMEARTKRQGGYHSQQRSYSPARAVKRLLGLRMLVAEDNFINQQVATGILESEGAEVTVVDHGGLAVDALSRRADAYDLVLMDVQMPVMDGLEATRRIRSHLRSSLPVVAMSAGVTHDERQLCLDAGMNDFIAKPLDPQLLVMTLRKLGLKVRDESAAQGAALPEPGPAPANEAAPPLPQIDGIDLPALVLALNGSREAADRLLRQFAQACERALGELESAAAQGNREAAAFTLHSLNGMAMNMRAGDIARHVAEVQAAVRREGIGAIRAQALPELGASVRSLSEAIRRMVW